MPPKPTVEQRAEWHAQHAQACGCRSIPASLASLVKAVRGILRPKLWRRVPASKRVPRPLYSIVTGEQAKLEPYPYLYVNADGSARELHPNERKYLETLFDPFDGARPYVKDSYAQKSGWGEINGFLNRSKFPPGVQIQPAPVEDPSKPLTPQDQIQLLRDKGWEAVENSDGSITASRPRR